MVRSKPYRGRTRRGARRVLTVFLILALICILAFAALLGVVLAGSHDEVKGEPKLMIVLGCQVKPWGPSTLLQDRLDKALEYLEGHPDVTVVCSGGQGPDEPVSEAQCMRDYLVEKGYPAEQILLEDRSRNTDQNLCWSMDVLARAGYDTTDEIVVVSNGFHLARVRMLCARRSSADISTLAAPSSHAPSRLKMYIREPIGLVKSFLLDGRGELPRTTN